VPSKSGFDIEVQAEILSYLFVFVATKDKRFMVCIHRQNRLLRALSVEYVLEMPLLGDEVDEVIKHKKEPDALALVIRSYTPPTKGAQRVVKANFYSLFEPHYKQTFLPTLNEQRNLNLLLR